MSDLADISLAELTRLMHSNGVRLLLSKDLAPNDNPKNQPYLGGNFQTLSILPVGEIKAEITEKGNETLKALLPFFWLQRDGSTRRAPHAKLILYPQYPEVRLSGFLQGASGAPSRLMSSREPGRLLVLGVTIDRNVIACAFGADDLVARQIRVLKELVTIGVFSKVPLSKDGERESPRNQLIVKLREIHERGWINSWALRANGDRVPCSSPQCVGHTLEAELGVPRNGDALPDFEGWEVKALTVSSFAAAVNAKAITLLTPEPDGGYYADHGAKAFVRKFGYADQNGIEDRLNFGGVHRNGVRHFRTGLTMTLQGFDSGKGKISDAFGALALLADDGSVAAAWSFSKLMQHWNRKHAQAVYVPAECNKKPALAYRYGGQVRMGEGTDFLKFLSAAASGSIYYDPGIKLEGATSASPRLKPRSQFRVKSSDLPILYNTMNNVDLLVQ